MPAPSPFKPSLVSEYFFGDGGSPGAGADPASLAGWNGSVQPTSSPDLESSPGGGAGGSSGRAQLTSGSMSNDPTSSCSPDTGGAQAVGMDMDLEQQAHPKSSHGDASVPSQLFPPHEGALPMFSAAPVVDPTPTKVTQPALPELVVSTPQMDPPRSIPNSVATPSHVFFPGSVQTHSASSTAGSSASVSSVSSPVGASSQAQKAHQRLFDAAMVDAAAVRTGAKFSAFSTPTSMVSSSAAPSHGDSPVSPMSDTQMSNQAHTPSPPPLTLPQNATHRQTGSEVSAASTRPQQPHVRAPASSPTRYRTVPAAASHIQPMVLPAHNAQVTPKPSPTEPSKAVQYAQTPKAESSQHAHPRNQQSQHPPVVTHSTPGTPQPPHRSVEPHHSHHGHHHHSYHGHKQLVDDPNAEYVGPFVLGPVLGRGCTGTVRLGTHRWNNFEVAFKIIEKKYLIGEQEGGNAPNPGATGGAAPPSSEVEQSKLWKKVKREIAILKLIEHPHVLKLYDVLETENRLYLVLEKGGGELFDYIVSKGRLERQEALRITAQIVMGLEHCHSHGICHRGQ
jgi:hypothetical protein